MSNNLQLTEYDYEYLQGNEKFWEIRGACFNVVYEDCKNAGYGEFGQPTARGLEAMNQYEIVRRGRAH